MTPDTPVRVRFAPSPTGYWHPGNARTALFTWLFARHTGGTFVLRIEDTDQARNTPEAIENLLESMRWLGMDWDEGPEVGGDYGPYFQSERLDIYRQAMDQLLAEGKAYYCFATPEELEQMREEQRSRGISAPKYDGRYRDYPIEEARKRIEAGERHVVRFRTELDQDVVVDDIVRGEVTFRSKDLDDFVIVKGDGFPVYNFACVIDDTAMAMTHVIRAEEHLSNTPRQILLYRAMGYDLPRFCHVPVVLNTQRKKLSKRDPGVQSILSYRGEGILPDAVMNYLALLGWSPGSEQEFFTRSELIEAFTLERVSPSPSVFDIRKLESVSSEHLKVTDTDALIELALPFFVELELCADPPTGEELADIKSAVDLLKTRAWNLRNLAESAIYLLRDEYPMDPKGVKKRLLKHDETPAALEAIADALAQVEDWGLEPIEEAFRTASESGGFHTGNAIHATRMAVTGSPKGPGLFECLEAVGRDRVVARMRKVAGQVRAGELAGE
jgi:glutamyl-tRNA synthetase